MFRKIFRKNKNVQNKGCNYKERFYKTWTDAEIKILDRQIKKDDRKGFYINLSSIHLIMPYRSISSLRCKVRERCALLGLDYGTYTEI